MVVKKKAQPIQRRKPRRRDSAATVEAIYGATARILRDGGRAALTTNFIAEVAGVSIGSLYAYFANKEEILIAMALRELDAMRDRAIAGMRGDGDAPVQGVVHALIAGYAGGGVVRRLLMETLIANGRSAELARPVAQVAQLILNEMGEQFPAGARKLDELDAFILTRAIDGLIRSAAYEHPALLSNPAFEIRVVALIERYLGVGITEGAGAR
jgi:AcrR family transcriptional regulator